MARDIDIVLLSVRPPVQCWYCVDRSAYIVKLFLPYDRAYQSSFGTRRGYEIPTVRSSIIIIVVRLLYCFYRILW